MELIRRPSNSSALGSLASAGRSADVSDVQFATRALTYDDIPTEIASSGSALVAFDEKAQSATASPRRTPLAFVARQEPGAFRVGGDVVQRRVALALHGDEVVKSIVERKLTRTDGSSNAYKPAGDWLVARRSTLKAKATKSVGKAPIERASASASSAHPGASSSVDDPYADETSRWPEGAEAIAYLPASVRRSLYARIPMPEDFDGKIVEYVDTKIVEVVVVRSTSANAVAAIAHLAPGSDTWDVTMLTYSNGVTKHEGRA